MDARRLLWKASGLEDPGEPTLEQQAALKVAEALDRIEASVAAVADALSIIDPLIPEEQARGMLGARLRLLADRLEESA